MLQELKGVDESTSLVSQAAPHDGQRQALLHNIREVVESYVGNVQAPNDEDGDREGGGTSSAAITATNTDGVSVIVQPDTLVSAAPLFLQVRAAFNTGQI